MDINESTDETSAAGTSRRAVLKAGVAVGVGTIAWSGPTITTLGGTPAYAEVCTQVAVVTIDIVSETNTNMSCNLNGFTYHTYQDNLKVGAIPSGYTLDLSNFSGQCANTPRSISWTSPPTIKCQLQFKIKNNTATPLGGTLCPAASCGTTYTNKQVTSPASVPSISKDQDGKRDVNANLVAEANARYGISLVCVPKDAQCYPDEIDF